jgi:thymidylate synthase (FAD)
LTGQSWTCNFVVMATDMKVTLIGNTALDRSAVFSLTGGVWEAEPDATDADSLAEFAGRACYQSWKRPNPATATTLGYHANTLDHGHFSIYEHASLTFYVEGVSRALTHELIRHRHLSYSQLSQRFVAEDKRDFEPVIPPAFRDLPEAVERIRAAFRRDMEDYRFLVNLGTENGLPRKQAREAARAVLPNSNETKIVVTGNGRAWREFITKRNDPHADAEIRELAVKVLDHLREHAPATVQDLI